MRRASVATLSAMGINRGDKRAEDSSRPPSSQMDHEYDPQIVDILDVVGKHS
jgi:hypothetical protein